MPDRPSPRNGAATRNTDSRGPIAHRFARRTAVGAARRTAICAAIAALAAFALTGCSRAAAPSPITTPGASGSSTAGGSSEPVTSQSASLLSPASSAPITDASTATSPTGSRPPESSQPPTTAAGSIRTRVYYVVDTRLGLRLARETRDFPAGIGAPAAAIAAMIAGPTDPDYSTTWNPATAVRSVRVDQGLVTVDLSGAARTANVGSPGASMMIQQLIWTVTEAVGQPDAYVRLLIDGVDAGELWGAVSWEAPIAREEPTAIRTLVQIDAPSENASVTSPVEIFGDAAAFEANVPWRVLDAAGNQVAEGHTMTTEGQTFAPYSFTVPLPPGRYTVEISQDDPSDGAAGEPYRDTRTITVTD